MANLDILSDRYARATNRIFSPRNKILKERELWIAVAKGQKELGMDIPSEAIEGYERAKRSINLRFIKELEMKRQHDVKARIEAFVKTAGVGEYIHLGMTARDLTDNVEQMQNKEAGQLIFGRYISVERHLLDKAHEFRDIYLTGRSHHQAAQTIVLGKRFAMTAEELLIHLPPFEAYLKNYPLRGIKGPMGTQFDMLTLLGTQEKVDKLEQLVAKHLGFDKVFDATGQVYPRSLDSELVNHLDMLASAVRNFAINMRLMAGYELVTEGFGENQVGSTAMPHKMNTPHSERIYGLSNLIKMYADGASRISGDQWEEGDVSCSAPRRVILSDAFYASDGLCETALDVLNHMGAYPVVIGREVDRYLPFMASTEILSMAVKMGVGREKAHALIKKHAVSEALKMRKEGIPPLLPERLAEEPLFVEKGISAARIYGILQDKAHFIGRAREQIDAVAAKAQPLLTTYAKQASYENLAIL